MNLMWWQKPGAARIVTAQLALDQADVELVEAQRRQETSERQRTSLADIRRNNHFTQSIFPKGS